jgi:hypothetical protein
MRLPVDEFLRRFLLHLLPRGFVRLRNSASSPTDAAPACCPSASNGYRSTEQAVPAKASAWLFVTFSEPRLALCRWCRTSWKLDRL